MVAGGFSPAKCRDIGRLGWRSGVGLSPLSLFGSLDRSGDNCFGDRLLLSLWSFCPSVLKKAEKCCKIVINISQTEVVLVVVRIPMLCGWYKFCKPPHTWSGQGLS